MRGLKINRIKSLIPFFWYVIKITITSFSMLPNCLCELVNDYDFFPCTNPVCGINGSFGGSRDGLRPPTHQKGAFSLYKKGSKWDKSVPLSVGEGG